MIYYVYIITNKWETVLYVGMTNNIQRRTHEHKNHVNKGFSHRYNCDRLVYYEEHDSPMKAIRREKYIKKKFSRQMKKDLISKGNPEWRDLSLDWCEPNL